MCKLNIAYSCNEAYMEQTAVSIISLFENNQKAEEINVYFVDLGVTDESKEYLKEIILSYGRSLQIIPFKDIAYDLKIKNTGRHIESVYAKLFFGRIPNVDRILYLDSDVVVVDSLEDFWNTNLDYMYFAGVRTLASRDLCRKLEISEYADVINDGVVLMNLDLWRKDDMLRKCQKYIDKWSGEPPVLSEGTINSVCNGKIKIVSPRCNLMSGLIEGSAKKFCTLTDRPFYSQDELDFARKNPCIIHFLSGFYNRPWCKKCSHPMKNQYFKYRKMTKWVNEPLKNAKLSIKLKIIGLLFKYIPTSLFCKMKKLIGHKSC